MRVRDNFKENKAEELKDRITSTLLAFALVVVPAGVVYKVEENRIETMQEYYQILLENETEKAYLQGYVDGIFGIQDNFVTPVNSKIDECLIEGIELINKMPEPEKKLTYVKKKNI